MFQRAITRVTFDGVGLESYSKQFLIYLFRPHLDTYISLLIDCVFEIHKIAVCYLLSLQGHYRVTDEV